MNCVETLFTLTTNLIHSGPQMHEVRAICMFKNGFYRTSLSSTARQAPRSSSEGISAQGTQTFCAQSQPDQTDKQHVLIPHRHGNQNIILHQQTPD